MYIKSIKNIDNISDGCTKFRERLKLSVMPPACSAPALSENRAYVIGETLISFMFDNPPGGVFPHMGYRECVHYHARSKIKNHAVDKSRN